MGKKKMLTELTPEERRANFKKWLEARNLSPFSAARMAGISAPSLYNFLNGSSKSLSTNALWALSKASGDAVEAILTGEVRRGGTVIIVTHRVGAGGRMHKVEEYEDTITLERPPGVDEDANVAAAIVDGTGLSPIPMGWAIFFEHATDDPENLIGAVAVVRYSGGGEKPVVRTIRRGTEPGLYHLQAMQGELLENVEIMAAHRVLSFAAPSKEQ